MQHSLTKENLPALDIGLSVVAVILRKENLLSENRRSMKGKNLISENLKVLVFSSNINCPEEVGRAQKELMALDDVYQVDVDLDDQDNVLRIECHPSCDAASIHQRMTNIGFQSDILM